MKAYARKMVKPIYLNASNNLFGGIMLQWIDEEAALLAMHCLRNKKVVTKFISAINFMNPGQQEDTVSICFRAMAVGKTSITFECEVNNDSTEKTIIDIDKIVFVNLDKEGRSPEPHGLTLEVVLERMNKMN